MWYPDDGPSLVLSKIVPYIPDFTHVQFLPWGYVAYGSSSNTLLIAFIQSGSQTNQTSLRSTT
jgi:hypothetical protein